MDQISNGLHNLTFTLIGASPKEPIAWLFGFPAQIPLGQCMLGVAPIASLTEPARGFLDELKLGNVPIPPSYGFSAQVIRLKDGSQSIDASNGLTGSCK